MSEATIGIFGGSGFYDLLTGAEEVVVETKYGAPSDKVIVGEYAGQKIAFLPRHGRNHNFSPPRVPYKANLAALAKFGVKNVIAPCAAGSLAREIKPGDFVILDQFVDRTRGREDTYYSGPRVAHISAAEPYCPELRQLATTCAQELNITVHPQGTVVVINGPRFSTKAESRWFSAQGWTVINMTQYPEVILARELGLCYTGIALITDYDVGLEGEAGIEPVTMEEVLKTFQVNNEKVKNLIFKMIEKMPAEKSCSCAGEIEKAKLF